VGGKPCKRRKQRGRNNGSGIGIGGEAKAAEEEKLEISANKSRKALLAKRRMKENQAGVKHAMALSSMAAQWRRI